METTLLREISGTGRQRNAIMMQQTYDTQAYIPLYFSLKSVSRTNGSHNLKEIKSLTGLCVLHDSYISKTCLPILIIVDADHTSLALKGQDSEFESEFLIIDINNDFLFKLYTSCCFVLISSGEST